MPEATVSIRIRSPIEKVWSFLSDMEKVGTCIPGVNEVKATGPDDCDWKMTIKIGFVSRTVLLKTHTTERIEPTRGSWVGEGEDVSVKGSVDIKDLGNGETEVVYHAVAEGKGQLRLLLNQAIGKLIKDQSQRFTEALKQKLESG